VRQHHQRTAPFRTKRSLLALEMVRSRDLPLAPVDAGWTR
jgi:hypothetical protein